MKKSRILAMALAASLAMGLMPTAAFAAPTASTGTIGGDGTVKEAVLEVVLPADLDFSFDPFEQGSIANNQIVSANYVTANKSLIPVKLEYTLTVTAEEDESEVEFVATDADIEIDNDQAKDLKVLMGALGATGVTGTVLFEDATGGTWAYSAAQSAANATLVSFAPNAEATKPTAAGTIAFALDAATGTGDPVAATGLAAGNAGVASFQFYAKMNTYAPWDAETFAVTANYTLSGLRAETYDAIVGVEGSTGDPDDPSDDVAEVPGRLVEGGLNQLISGGSVTADVTIAAGGNGSVTVARTAFDEYTVLLTGRPAEVTTVMSRAAGATTSYDYEPNTVYDPVTGILTVRQIPLSGASATLTITAAGGAVYTVNITITA